MEEYRLNKKSPLKVLLSKKDGSSLSGSDSASVNTTVSLPVPTVSAVTKKKKRKAPVFIKQKKGIRMYDMGVWRVGDVFDDTHYVAGETSDKLMDLIQSAGDWKMKFRRITKIHNTNLYSLNLSSYYKDDPSETVPIGKWGKGDRFQFNVDGWEAITDQDNAEIYYDVISDDSGYKMTIDGYSDEEDPVANNEAQYGALVECAITKYNHPESPENGYVITNTPTPPGESDTGIFTTFHKTADWYFVPRLCQSVAVIRDPGMDIEDHVYLHYVRLDRAQPPFPDTKDIWASHLSILPRGAKGELRGYTHERETPMSIPPDGIDLFSKVLSLTPAYCCNYVEDSMSIPSLSDLTVNKNFAAVSQDPVHPYDLWKFNTERVPEMIIDQGGEILYLWNTNEWWPEEDKPYGDMPWNCYVWGNDTPGVCKCGTRSWHCF